VGIHEENVGSLNVNEGWGWVLESLFGTEAHDILDTRIEQFGGHDHAIGFTIIGNQFEDSSRRHILA